MTDKETSSSPPAISTDNHIGSSGTNPFESNEGTPVAAVVTNPQSSPPPTSTSPPQANALSTPTPSLPERPREAPVDPKVAALRAMFPDFDDAVLQSVLESVGGNQDRAIDSLLGMSDPDYRSEVPAAPVLSQTDLDEQLARRLMLEDEEREHSWQAQRGAAPQPDITQRYNQRQQQSSGDKDIVAEFTEQFNRVAETGKKTFGSLFSKGKAFVAKMQDSDQNRSGSSSGTEPRWGLGPAGTDYQYTPQQAQQPYYASSAPVTGYDTTNSYGQNSMTTPAPKPPSPNTNTRPSTDSAPITLVDASIPRSSQTGSGTPNPIDAGKLGLLPKKPVSLLRTQSPPIERKPSSDDELEYVENPFEDSSSSRK